MTNESLALLQFTLKRLVFVNSAKHAYSELLLDQHLAMFGRNNNGKTASLAATKLLLFPETNFRHCFNKFGFEGKDGPYDAEQSFRFYFPTIKSYIALEVENPSGTFTMVLYRAASSEKNQSFAYHRAFIPLPYEQVRQLFWNMEEEDFSEQLGTEQLTKFTQKNRGLIIHEASKLRQMIFARLGSPEAQYCIVPLKDNTTDSINAFRKIYNLAFSMSSNVSEVLPSAIAALIEMQRGRQEEKLDHDLDETYQKYLQLNKQSENLKLKQNNLERFNQLAHEFHGLNQATNDYSLQSHRIHQYVDQKINTLLPVQTENQQTLNDLNKTLRELKSQIEQVKTQRTECHSQIELREKDLNNINKKIEQAGKVQCEYPPSMTIHEIKHALHVDTQELIEKRDLLRDFTKAETAFQSKRKQLLAHQQKLEQLNQDIQTLKNQQDKDLLINQISEHSLQILYNLNPALVKISQVISVEEKKSIESFTQLFQLNTSHLDFKQHPTQILFHHYQPEQLIVQLENQHQQLHVQSQDLEIEVKELEQLIRDANNPELHNANEQKLTESIELNQTDIGLLDALQSHKERFKEYSAEIEVLNEQKLKLDEQFQILNIQFDDLKTQQGNCQSILDQLNDQQDKFKRIKHSLENAANMFDVLPSTRFDAELFKIDHGSVDELLEQAQHLTDQARKLQKQYNDYVFKFTQFSNEVPTADLDLNRVHIRLDELEHSVEIYKNVFANLDLEQQQFNHAVLGHNEEIRSQIHEINEAQDQLHRVVAMINKKLNQHQISNLTEIRLHLETVSDFDALKNTLDKYNISGETLAEESFYLSLIAFFNKHQEKGRLKMANLIQSIQYRYKIDGQEVMKSQSGGTTTTITSFVLSVLLNEIKLIGSSVRIPIIVDEISALDAENTASTIQQIGEYGFSIFCATPELTAYLVSEVGRYIYINQNVAKHFMEPECQWNIMPHHVNHWGIHEVQS
ncbi:coiled-coil domain-containing protein [Acinetobacter shaoyimingii]|uniref:Uncharacterized protein n=1 Tax=Acinetobacter shaoyimingii TaxID=2715164 RepID=A0A6G8RVL2_9GAMM|nr:hypothetical protein [Acinetobacter shaoyimingii]QIO05870.1 hypothetical protein G8E00_07845 [Acinetobacter shaoyimingii]